MAAEGSGKTSSTGSRLPVLGSVSNKATCSILLYFESSVPLKRAQEAMS
jgi:hypothetical protein